MTEQEEKKIISEIVKELRRKKPLIIGLPAFCTEVNEVTQLAALFKKKFKDATIVVGGVQPTLYPDTFLYSDSPFDVVVIGEGEQTLFELISRLKNKQNIDDITGTAYFHEGKIVVNQPRQLIKDLDTNPFPAYDKVDMEYYLKPSIYGIRWLLFSCFYIFTSRGCPALCRFCVNKNLWKSTGNQKIVRFRSIQNVVDEIEYLVKNYHIDAIYVYDDSFVINSQRVKDFCVELKNRKLNLVWGCEVRVDKITDEIVKTMKDAGCIQIDFGVESGSPKCLARVQKNITIEQIENAFAICRKYDMRTFANFLTNFPDETEEDVQLTLDLAKRIKATEYSFAIMTPFPGTDIFHELNLKLEPKDYDLFKDAIYSEQDPRFRMAKHNLDLRNVVTEANVKFNSPLQFASPVVMHAWSKKWLSSKRKLQYLLALKDFGVFALTHVIPRILAKNLSGQEKQKKSK